MKLETNTSYHREKALHLPTLPDQPHLSGGGKIERVAKRMVVETIFIILIFETLLTI